MVTESFLGPLTWVGLSVFIIIFCLVVVYFYKNHKERQDIVVYEYLNETEAEEDIEKRKQQDKVYQGLNEPEVQE